MNSDISGDVRYLYDWLSQGPTPDCDRILAAALRHAEPPWAERMVQVLLRRGQEASWAALIGRYGGVEPGARAQLQECGDRMRAGIALALRSSAPETRANALLALEERPDASMAYVLPDAIRDPAPKLRARAGRLWRRMADTFLEQPAPPAGADEACHHAYEAQRCQLVLALQDMLRTFDQHHRLEVLETCLWFARELGDTLWKKLASRRSRAGMMARECLLSWNHPRLAHALVSALKQPAWRETAGRVLRTWKTVPQVSALLRESDLLGDPKIRGHLSFVRRPQWFSGCDDDLTELAPELRPLAPRWVCHAAYREREKTTLLSRWLRTPDPRLHHAVVYALAEIDDAGARALLKQVADSDSPLASFARWCVSALDTDLVRSAMSAGGKRRRQAKRGPGFDPARADEGDADHTMLRQACRPTAQRQARSRQQQTVPLRASPVERPRREVVTAGQAHDQAQREFRAALERLSTGAAHPADADLIDRACELMQDVYIEQFDPAPAGVLQGRGS